ncbi:hypothetical protein MXB_3586, partial [Myxobolus squamalis]
MENTKFKFKLILKWVKNFVLGEYPHIHCLSMVSFLLLALFLAIRVVFTGINSSYNYIPPLISDVAVEPLSKALLLTFLLMGTYSYLVYIKAKYSQLKEFNWNESANTLMYLIGLASTISFPLVFIFETTDFLIG